MPGFDGTGPMGYGPRTGGGFGTCPPVSGPAPYRGPYPYFGVGRGGYPRGGGRGRAWGGGRGMGWRAYPSAGGGAYYPNQAPVGGTDPRAESEFLRGEASRLQGELEGIRRRIEELETEVKPGEDKK